MASLIENLIHVLDEESTEYQKLLDISMEKTSVIVEQNVEHLQNIMLKEQPILDRLNRLEDAREEHLGDISNVLDVPMEQMKVDKLIHLLEKQPKDQAALIQVHDKLNKIVKQLVKVNDNNKLLLQESLDMLEFELNLAKNTRMAPETANYGRNAQGTYPASSTFANAGMFDAKQ